MVIFFKKNLNTCKFNLSKVKKVPITIKRKKYIFLAQKRRPKFFFKSPLKKIKWMEFCNIFVWKGLKKSRLYDFELIQGHIKSNLVRWSKIFWILPIGWQYNRSPQLIKQLKSFFKFQLPNDTIKHLNSRKPTFSKLMKKKQILVKNKKSFIIWANNKITNIDAWLIEEYKKFFFPKNDLSVRYYTPVFLGNSFLKKNIRFFFFLEKIKFKNFFLFILLRLNFIRLISNQLKLFKTMNNFFFQNYSKKKILTQINFFFWLHLWFFFKKEQLSLFFFYFSLKLKPFMLKKDISLFFSLEHLLVNNEKFLYISKNYKKSMFNKILLKKKLNQNYNELYKKFFFIFNKINFFFNNSKFYFKIKKKLPIKYDLKEICLETNKKILLVSKNYKSLSIEDLLIDIFKIFEPHKKLIHFRKITGRGAKRKVLNFYSKFSLKAGINSNSSKKPLHWFKDIILRDKKYFKVKEKPKKYIAKNEKLKDPILRRVNSPLRIRISSELDDLIFQKGDLIKKQNNFETLLFIARWRKHYRW